MLLSALQPFFAGDPLSVVLQGGMAVVGFLLVFFILYTLRDILLRTELFLYQLLCIVLVAALPIVGFLLYLLVRPARTVRQRRLEAGVEELIARLHRGRKHNAPSALPRHQGAKQT